jgi:polyamine oxidase
LSYNSKLISIFNPEIYCAVHSGLFLRHIDGQNASPPSVIVIGGGISGIAAARALSNASFKVNAVIER